MSPKTTICNGCGVVVKIYNPQSMRNHERVCVYPDIMESEDDEYRVLCNAEHGNRSSLNAFLEEPMMALCEPVVSALVDDFPHLTQFCNRPAWVCTEGEMQLVKFMSMAQSGYGVSRNFSKSMLKYAKASGGKNLHLPDSWGSCVNDMTRLIEKMQGKRKTYTLDVSIPHNVRLLLADPDQTHVAFEFECPITEMVRIAMFSDTCQDWNNVALSYEDNDGYLDDFCNGDRYKRIAADISPTGAILGAVLATDGICLDKCMFDSQEVRKPCISYKLDFKLDLGPDC